MVRFFSIRRSALLIPLCTAAACALAAPAHAKECRTDPDVIASADPDKNTDWGGHVLTHIIGEKLPAGQSRVKKSAFVDRAAFVDVWGKYLQIKTGKGEGVASVNCQGKGSGQTVTVRKLYGGKQDKIDGYSCSDKECTAPNPDKKQIGGRIAMKFDQVSFFFELIESVDKKTKKTIHYWVLTTAYPTN